MKINCLATTRFTHTHRKTTLRSCLQRPAETRHMTQ